MSTIEIDHLARHSGQNSPFENQHPRANEGVLLPADMCFDTTVKDIYAKSESRDESGNVVTNYRLRMSDDALYNLRSTVPPDVVTDIAVWKTPAWTTNSRGHNQRTGQQLGKIKLANVEVSALGEERDSLLHEAGRAALRPYSLLRDLHQVGLARQAHVMLSAVQQADMLKLNNNTAFWFGESRGAMTLMGACAMAPHYDVTIPYALAVAPCFYEGLSWKSIQEQRGQIREETTNLIRLMGNVSLARLMHYPNTMNASPKSFVYEMAHAPTLFRGDAGKLAHYIPLSQNMQVLAYTNDIAGQHSKWQKHFEDYPDVTVRPVPGAHLSIADKRTLHFVSSSFERISEQLAQGASMDEVDISRAHRRLATVI